MERGVVVLSSSRMIKLGNSLQDANAQRGAVSKDTGVDSKQATEPIGDICGQEGGKNLQQRIKEL